MYDIQFGFIPQIYNITLKLKVKYFDYDTKNKRQALIDMRVRPVGIDLSIANIAYITTSKSISQEKLK